MAMKSPRMCRKTHKFVMDLLDSEIRAIVDKQREREAEVLARNDYPVDTGLKIRDMMHEVIEGNHKERKIG